ncbi:MAG: DUF3052 domain-containing protein [Acidobacteria bacterium]|nr:MAG: DUF3052 domain-containing protein [Acidobacteriota bacterium]
MAGYSTTPLVKKLGIKENSNAAFVNAPAGFVNELGLPKGVKINTRASQPRDFILMFVKSKRELETAFSLQAAKLTPTGTLWISWPKKASGVVTDLNENIVRDIGLANGLVDVKVCAVDDIWSGLKFVFRLKDRPAVGSR